MTREEVLSVSPDLSKEQLDKILKMYGEGIVREKNRTTELEKKYNDLQTMYNNSLSTVSDLEKIAKDLLPSIDTLEIALKTIKDSKENSDQAEILGKIEENE